MTELRVSRRRRPSGRTFDRPLRELVPTALVDRATTRRPSASTGRLFDGGGRAESRTAWSRSGRRTRDGRYGTTAGSAQGFRLRASGTEDAGGFEFVTVKPGRVSWPEGGLQAPHLEVGVFARGLLKRVVTRHLLPGRGGRERRGSGALALVARPARGARRGAGRRRASLRHPLAGRRADDILRGVTTSRPLFVPDELARRGLRPRVARRDARRRAGARAGRGARRRDPRRGRERRSPRPATSSGTTGRRSCAERA